MKYLFLFSVMTFWFTATSQNPNKAEDSAAVESILRDYIEGWYKGDTVRMDRSLHDELVKRIPIKDSTDLHTKLIMVSKSRMVELTGKGGGETPDAEYQIFIDDIEKDIATARVLSLKYLDYLHLVKTNEGWQIVNILFHSH